MLLVLSGGAGSSERCGCQILWGGRRIRELQHRCDGSGSLPMLDHELEFFDERIDLLEIFPASFLRL